MILNWVEERFFIMICCCLLLLVSCNDDTTPQYNAEIIRLDINIDGVTYTDVENTDVYVPVDFNKFVVSCQVMATAPIKEIVWQLVDTNNNILTKVSKYYNIPLKPVPQGYTLPLIVERHLDPYANAWNASLQVWIITSGSIGASDYKSFDIYFY